MVSFSYWVAIDTDGTKAGDPARSPIAARANAEMNELREMRNAHGPYRLLVQGEDPDWEWRPGDSTWTDGDSQPSPDSIARWASRLSVMCVVLHVRYPRELATALAANMGWDGYDGVRRARREIRRLSLIPLDGLNTPGDVR